ncbi:MAG: hypothetical protein HC880_21490 [Bacteroidia bacterium]|nr:hypothetical protein [Bacteroidia bacterium]
MLDDFLKKNNDRNHRQKLQMLQGSLRDIEDERDLGILTVTDFIAKKASVRRAVLNLIGQVRVAYAPVNRPVIFLAFANDPGNYLHLLKKEKDAIYQSLQPWHDNHHIEIFTETWEDTRTSEIFETFARFRDRLTVFHYAGHANSAYLRLSEGDAKTSGLVKLFEQQKNLRLVFLNGCATRQDIVDLMPKDTPQFAVIATSTQVHDEAAGRFAAQFYRSLASRATLNQAFEEARALLEAENSLPSQKMHRFLSAEIDITTLDKNPWGLFVPDPALLEWKLV